MITLRAFPSLGFVVQKSYGLTERPGAAARYPRATSHGRRVKPGQGRRGRATAQAVSTRRAGLSDKEVARFGSQTAGHTANGAPQGGAVRSFPPAYPARCASPARCACPARLRRAEARRPPVVVCRSYLATPSSVRTAARAFGSREGAGGSLDDSREGGAAGCNVGSGV